MIILALDPSSTCTGCALLDDSEATLNGTPRLIEAGLIRPARPRARSFERVESMTVDVSQLLNTHSPNVILVEFPSTHTGARHQGAGFGLAVYGFAVGAMWQCCRQWLSDAAHSPRTVQASRGCSCILADNWTRRVAKSVRQRQISLLFPSYRAADDPGGDIADALGLALWYCRDVQLKSNYPAPPGLETVWRELSLEEKGTALLLLQEGFTTEELIEHLERVTP